LQAQLRGRTRIQPDAANGGGRGITTASAPAPISRKNGNDAEGKPKAAGVRELTEVQRRGQDRGRAGRVTAGPLASVVSPGAAAKVIAADSGKSAGDAEPDDDKSGSGGERVLGQPEDRETGKCE
jgi:hypothetical protein